ncbi:2Fe-2S iron-sulfur cluster-binding protein [Variovorax saccharolyticus]|uniref:2Fe-2S iron-sulfur cluster-binding protein n=1 Tax=Variovorax saccharolyticus TaxID=3053516 RepID=UPI002577D11F|nr:2Fe-2S iron-sulfur cluster-binding protein [Variovorax sp. J22R187]MDM0018900.1 2Fe-2S iron-sulfur cluster-binding protein [Variovorax sp. J22R187]
MAFRIQVIDSAQSFEAEPGESVLDAALRHDLRLPHECRFGGCATCRIKLVEGAVRYDEFPPGLTPEEAEEGYALACQARPASDLVISAARRLPPCSEPARHLATVLAVQPLCDDVLHLSLEVPPEAELLYRPGQYINILLPDGGHRSFSMASRPHPQALDFHIRRIPEGRFTSGHAARLRPGDRLSVDLPHGNFCFHAEDYRPLLMVATGTGLAPIKSILESLMDDEDCPPVSLYWGMRTEADLYLQDEIRSWADRFDDFRYVPVLSRADAGWSGRRGHVQQAVLEDFEDLSEHAIYLCGSPAMIGDAKRAFLARNASIDHLYSDSFTFQSTAAA